MSSRLEIRENVVDTLEASALIIGSGAVVWDSRGSSIQPRETLAIVVSTPKERLEERSSGQPVYRQIVECHVESHTTGDSSREAMAAADELEELTRRALLGDLRWRGCYEKILRIETVSAVSKDSSVWRAVAVLILDLQRSREFPAEDDLEYFERIHIDTDLYPPDTEIEVEQDIEVPT